MGLDFTMNSLLFSDSVVSDNYHNNGKMNFLTSIVLSIVSSLIGNIISKIFVDLSTFSIYFETVHEEIKSERFFIEICSRIIPFVKKKLAVYIILDTVMLLFFIYYVSIFCIVYKNNQMKWFIDCLTGVCTSIIITFILSILAAIVRSIAIKRRSLVIYKLSQYIISQ